MNFPAPSRPTVTGKFLSYVPPFLLFLSLALGFAGLIGIAELSAVICFVFFTYGIGNTRKKGVSFARLILFLVVPAPVLFFADDLGLPVMILLPAGALLAVGLGLVIGSQWPPHERTPGPVLALAAGALLLYSSFILLPQAIEKRFIDEENIAFPPFELLSSDGKPLRSDALTGRVVVIDFWASWCGPCLRAFPELEKLHRRYDGDPRVFLVAVNSGWRGETQERAFAFAKERGLPFPVAFDPGGRLSVLFGIRSIPTTVILDKNGTLRFRHRGSAAGTGLFVQTMQAKIESILGE